MFRILTFIILVTGVLVQYGFCLHALLPFYSLS